MGYAANVPDTVTRNASPMNFHTDLRSETSFVPSLDTSRAYRNALGQFGTGVTVVTANTERGPIGMTANSFASVSLNPALVLWSLAKTSGRFDAFNEAQSYAIHLIPYHQKEIALGFAKAAQAFDLCDWQMSNEQVPLINGALARFECQQSAVHDAGDHVIIVGQVQNVTCTPGEPLIFANGEFGKFD